MPTLRLIIMLGELVGFISISIIFVIKSDNRRRKKDKYTEKELIKEKKEETILVGVSIFISLAIFFLSFPQLIFMSWHKVIYLSVFCVACIINMLCYYLIDPILGNNYVTFETQKNEIKILLFWLSLLVKITVFSAVLYFSIFGKNVIPVKKFIDQKEEKTTIYPESVYENKKIGHIKGTNKYIFISKDSNGNRIVFDDLMINPENLIQSEITYVEKHTIKKVFHDLERKPESKYYIIRDEETTYIIYYNKEDILEVDKAK